MLGFHKHYSYGLRLLGFQLLGFYYREVSSRLPAYFLFRSLVSRHLVTVTRKESICVRHCVFLYVGSGIGHAFSLVRSSYGPWLWTALLKWNRGPTDL